MNNNNANFFNIIKEIGEFIRLEGLSSDDFVEWIASRDLICGWDRRDVYQACLGRLPEREIGPVDWPYDTRLDCAKHVVACILSREFRENAVKIIGDSRPDIRRIFFTHIPKTAGTSVRHYFDDNFDGICWNTAFSDDDYWLEYETGLLGITPLDFMLKFIGQFDNGKELLVTGHKPISHWTSRRLIRATDQVFSVIRQPREMVISGLSYVASLVLSDHDRIDAVGWRKIANYVENTHEDGATRKEIDLKSILRSDLFVSEFKNNLTRFLSADGTADGAVYLASLVNCKILTAKNMEKFLQDFFKSKKKVAIHNSSKFDAASLLDDSDINYIDYYLCSEDERAINLFLEHGLISSAAFEKL